MTGFLLPLEMPSIEAALRDARGGSEEARWVAAIALGHARGPGRQEAIEALDHLLSDPFEEIRAQALEGITEQVRAGAGISNKQASSLFKDISPAVRCVAVEAATVLLEKPVPALMPLLADPDPSVRAAAAAELGELGAGVDTDKLAELLDDADSFVTMQAAAAMAALGDSRGEPLLLSLVDDNSDDALEAVVALSRLGSAKSVASLSRLASRWFSPIELKTCAAAAMVSCGATEGLGILTGMLNARRQSTRMATLTSLARVPVQGIAHEVGRLLEGGRPMEVSAAIQTLGALARVDLETVKLELERRRKSLDTELDGELKEMLASIDKNG
ncbi:MAG: hypothetical protein GY854_12005 [Deltaproteobacteria bacterium]|nr:hypothetical protein [Deltaproteobacteria bacterium]